MLAALAISLALTRTPETAETAAAGWQERLRADAGAG